ncbi:hypothetical protein ACFL16_02060 [Patescibacteria group bacterium]
MNEFFKKNILTLSITLLLILFGFTAQAENKIDVEYSSGTNINQNDIFKANDIYPGWSKSETIKVSNDSETDSVNLYFNFDTKGTSKLSKKLKIYVIRTSNNSYRIGGEGDRQTLHKIDDKNLYTDHLEPGESNNYKIKLVFDKDAGNEYQESSVKFNIDFSVEAKTEEGVTEEEILIEQDREDFTGLPPEEENTDNEEITDTENESSVAGAQAENTGNVSGKQNSCESWPLQKWLLILLAYLLAFNFNSFYKLSTDYERIRWFWQIIYTALTILIWYLFDECRYFPWFPIATIISGAASYEYYLHRVKQKLRDRKA